MTKVNGHDTVLKIWTLKLCYARGVRGMGGGRKGDEEERGG